MSTPGDFEYRDDPEFIALDRQTPRSVTAWQVHAFKACAAYVRLRSVAGDRHAARLQELLTRVHITRDFDPGPACRCSDEDIDAIVKRKYPVRSGVLELEPVHGSGKT